MKEVVTMRKNEVGFGIGDGEGAGKWLWPGLSLLCAWRMLFGWVCLTA
jgi:hypothetical protein